MRGVFIVIYGVNNIGKSTQAKRLVAYLQERGYKAEYLKYPIYDSPTGIEISSILRSDKRQKLTEEEFQALYYRNRKDYEPKLKAKLDAGVIIVCEDYVGTGLAWGSAKGADIDALRRQNSDLLQEDLAILMDGERFIKGMEEKHLHERDADLMIKVRRRHRELAEELGWRPVEANQAEDAVFSDILALVRPRIPHLR
jgi:dTMP kinase